MAEPTVDVEHASPEARSLAPTPIRDGEAPALGSDPFAELDGPDPFLSGLEALGLDAVPSVASRPAEAPPLPPREREAIPTPLVARRRSGTPPLRDVELPEDASWLERWIPADERKHIAALQHLVGRDTPYDAFGFSPDVARRAFPFLYSLYRFYFRVRSEGHEHLPPSGPGVLAGNHAGLLPFDGAMVVLDSLLHTDPPRLPRAVVDLWAGRLPWVNVFYARVGQVIGTRDNVRDLLDDEQLLLVFPEGMDGVRKTITQRYRLQRFHVGFVEQALIGGAPIIPLAVIGSDDQTPILYDFPDLAKRFGLPALPITPTFPWFGPLGLLPYPVGYHIVYGEPLRFHERYGPNDAEDPRLVRYLASKVRHAIQRLIDRHR